MHFSIGILLGASFWLGISRLVLRSPHPVSSGDFLLVGVILPTFAWMFACIPLLAGTLLRYRSWYGQPDQNSLEALLDSWALDLKACEKQVDQCWEGMIELCGALLWYGVIATIFLALIWLLISVVRWMWNHSLV